MNSEPIIVTLTAIVSGTLNDNPTISYRDETGAVKSETLTVGAWNKTLTVGKEFNLLLKISGSINGIIQLKASATGAGVSYNDVRNLSTNVDTVLDLEISSTL
ncbi:hypothetical protein [Tenacibaculum sp. Bg11-29]|uniref:hypothetical protein n=1 Tax=Tenacibaculum sp. Bg11-29 TaxID=2058306 RepID=UPI0012FE8528|nr:hypothetical protein [Tenacibaculum sp. Bg11-29]